MFQRVTKDLRLFLLIIVFSAVSFNFAQNNLTPLPAGVSIYQLDNGLQLMLIEKPSLPMVGINTVVKVGSAFENFATSGMSHMLEHLLFNGTTSMTQKELYDSTDVIGGYNNANTGEYYTNFMMVTPAENILDGMKLQSAMLFDSVIPEEKFEKEKGIVLEEIAKSLAKSSEQIENNILSIIYDGHALSLPTLGTYSTIKNMKRDDVYQFYKNYYTPNNMIVSIIGNFNSADMFENLKELYGKVNPSEVEYPSKSGLATGFNSIENSKRNNIFHRSYGGDNTQLQMFFEVNQPQNLELFEILQLVLDEQKDSIRNKLNNNYNEQIEGVEFSTREFPVLSYIQATLVLKSENNLQDIQKSFLELFYKIKFEISGETINTEAIKTRTRFLKNTEKPHMFGIYNADLFGEYGIEEILSSYVGNGFLKATKELSNFELNKSYITIIQHPQINNKSETVIENSKTELFEVINGGPTIISRQNKGSDLLAIHYLIKNKAKFESTFGKGAAKLWHDAFGKRMENPEIQKISSKYGFTFTVNDNPYIPMDNIYLSPEFGYIRVEGLAEDVQSAIAFLNEQMLSFLPSKEEFESAQGKLKKPTMMGHSNSAKKIFDSKLELLLYEEEKYSKSNTDLNYEKLVEFGKEYFIPSNMIISIVSKAEGGQIKNYFSSFEKSSDKSENSLGYIKGFQKISKAKNIEAEGGGEQSYLYYGFQKEVEENDKAALQVLSLILSDKIVFDIREKQGMAYRMSAGVDVKKDKAMFFINMGTRPGNVEKLIPQFEGFFNQDLRNEVTDKLVKKSVNMYLGRMMFRRLSSINQAYYLGYSKYFYDDILHDSNSLEAIKKVSADEVKSVINKYMIVENPVEIYVR